MRSWLGDSAPIGVAGSLEDMQRIDAVFKELIALIISGNLTDEQLRHFLERDPDILSKRDNDGRFPLLIAIFKSDNKIIKLLLDHGADVHQKFQERTSIAMVKHFQKLAIRDKQFELDINSENIKRLQKASSKQPKSSSQHNLMLIGKMLGYEVSKGGVCHGYSHMAMQAFLLKRGDGNALNEFNDRMIKLKTISPEKHVENLANARAKIIFISKEAEKMFPDNEIAKRAYIEQQKM